MRLLIIEDDKPLSYELREGLERKGFAVDVANTGNEGEEKAFVTDYEAVLLDLNLPDKDGMEILEFLRKENRDIPIIIISARNTSRDRIEGLDMGADDYVVKPFDFDELASRIHAVVRRFYKRSSTGIKVGRLMVDPVKRLVSYDGENVELSAKEFDILCYIAQCSPAVVSDTPRISKTTTSYIAQCSPAVVSGEAIAEHVYDEFYDPFSSVLRVHIANLRRKLKNAAGHDVLITRKGIGYELCEE